MTQQLYEAGGRPFKWSGLDQLFAQAVVEVIFPRRNPTPGLPTSRRMLATTNWSVLNSTIGMATLHYHPPTGPAPYNAPAHNLLTVWHILWQDWRNINLNGFSSSNVVAVMPCRTPEEIETFWKFFSEKIINMSANEKQRFMRTT